MKNEESKLGKREKEHSSTQVNRVVPQKEVEKEKNSKHIDNLTTSKISN
jgi:hypothetical protein